MSTNGWGANLCLHISKKIGAIFLKKRKICGLLWNRKICILLKKILSKTYVLDHSGSFDMHIGKRKKKKFGDDRKKTAFAARGGGSARYGNVRNLYFSLRLPYHLFFPWFQPLLLKVDRQDIMYNDGYIYLSIYLAIYPSTIVL